MEPGAKNPGRREPIAAALYTLLSAAARNVVNLRTSSRVIKSFDQVEPIQMPALFQIQKPETQEHTPQPIEGLPARRTMHFELWLYTADAQGANVIPSQQLNLMVDAVEAALAGLPLTGKLTLGGLCSHCWIEGNVEYYENVNADGKSIAVIPIAAMMP